MTVRHTLTKIVADRFGEPDVLRIVADQRLPVPGPGEVLLKVEAAGVGFTDTAVRRGKYFPYRGGVPVTPGYDIIGTVDVMGPDVTTLAIGDRVADIPVTGGYATHIVRPATSLVKITRDLDPAIAACVPLVWVTAWQMLTRLRVLPQNSWVLVVGASGGVGTAMIVIARHLGLRVIGTCSPDNFDRVASHGAVPVDYNDPAFAEKIRSISGGGVTAAFDAIGGESARKAEASRVKGGLFVSYGAQALTNGARSLAGLILDMVRVLLWWNRPAILGGRGRSMMYLITNRRKKHPEQYAEDVRYVSKLLASGELTSPAIERIGFGGIITAHAAVEAGINDRKFVIDMRNMP